ncbi:tautomerase family protein [Sphingomonas sp. UYP23]
MPFVSIRISGSATKDQKSAIVADVTQSLVERLGKNPAAVQIVIEEVSLENYGAGGILLADRDAPKSQPAPKSQEDAHAESSQ